MARAVGIDIGSRNLKILELERSSGSKYRITFFQNTEIQPGETPEATQKLCTQVIKDAFEKYHLETDNLVLGLPSQDCILREVSVDVKSDSDIRQMIKFECERYLHGYELEDVVVDYYKIQEINNKTQLLLVVVPKIKILAQRLDILKACNLDPMIIDLDIMGLANAFRLTEEYKTKERVAVLDFGVASVKVLIFDHQKLRHAMPIRLRSMPKDSINLTASQREINLLSPDGLDLDLSEILLPTAPGPEGQRLVLMKKNTSEEIAQQKKNEDFLRRVIKELKRFLASIHLDDPIQIFCITGGSSQNPATKNQSPNIKEALPELRARIEQEFNIPTDILDFTQGFIQYPQTSKDELMIYGPCAFGMALPLLDSNYPSMNFRQEEYSYTNRFELIKKPVAIFTTLLCILCFLLAFYVHRDRINHEKAYETLLDKAKICYEQIYKDESLTGDKLDQIKNFHRKIEKIIRQNESAVEQPNDVLQQTLLIFQQMKQVRTKFYITIHRFNIRKEDIIVEGEIQDDSSGIDCLEKAIKEVKQALNTTDKKISATTDPNNSPSDIPLKYRYQLNIDCSTKEN